jgi:hypothetical protein
VGFRLQSPSTVEIYDRQRGCEVAAGCARAGRLLTSWADENGRAVSYKQERKATVVHGTAWGPSVR